MFWKPPLKCWKNFGIYFGLTICSQVQHSTITRKRNHWLKPSTLMDHSIIDQMFERNMNFFGSNCILMGYHGHVEWTICFIVHHMIPQSSYFSVIHLMHCCWYSALVNFGGMKLGACISFSSRNLDCPGFYIKLCNELSKFLTCSLGSSWMCSCAFCGKYIHMLSVVMRPL